MSGHEPTETSKGTQGPGRSGVDTIAWALLFIWSGTTLLMHGGVGTLLVGLGATLAGTEIVRAMKGQDIDKPFMICGAFALLAGLLEIVGSPRHLGPAVLIALGAGLIIHIVSAWRLPPR